MRRCIEGASVVECRRMSEKGTSPSEHSQARPPSCERVLDCGLVPHLVSRVESDLTV